VIVATLATLAGCGTQSPPSSEHSVAITERDFHITAPTTLVAGDVTLAIHNAGPERHQLLIVRTGGDDLPLRADGVTIDEQKVSATTLGRIDPQEAGGTRFLKLHLAPGRYTLFCNMAGHYLGGMEAALVVR
jgi:uncharacterized cupredoxin-like copper-binding protein